MRHFLGARDLDAVARHSQVEDFPTHGAYDLEEEKEEEEEEETEKNQKKKRERTKRKG